MLSYRYFQRYSNNKRNIRYQLDDLLGTKGVATAALALPSLLYHTNQGIVLICPAISMLTVSMHVMRAISGQGNYADAERMRRETLVSRKKVLRE